jgi:hypothetical protein
MLFAGVISTQLDFAPLMDATSNGSVTARFRRRPWGHPVKLLIP